LGIFEVRQTGLYRSFIINVILLRLISYIYILRRSGVSNTTVIPIFFISKDVNKTVLFAPIFPYSLKRENRGVGNIGLPANTIWNGYATWFTVFIKCALVFLFSVSSVIVKGQPVASFTFTDTAGCSPLVARFTNTSTGATSYSWDLGNGITSSSTDVSASYTSAGSYTVTLTAYGGGLHSTYSTVIRIYGKPIVSFSANDTAVCENAPVTFTSTSVSNAWGGISYIWNFGDGRSSTAASPVYAYPASGFYNVTLFAANSKGCSNSITRSAYIDVFVPPSIIFAAMTTDFCSAPATTSFINATTGKAPLAYTWAFGDGVSSTATAPSHTYSVPAIYNINLIAHDGYGCTDSSLQLNYITVENMKAAFVPVPNGCVNAPVTFNNASTPHISSQWYFGDGGTSTSDTAVYTYSAPGTYTIKLVISDGGCSDTVAHAITISSPPGSFTITHNCAPPYSSQTFTAATAPGNTVAWIFGDGATGSSSPVTHVYHPPPYMFTPPIPDPVYNVDMILTSGLGCTDTVKMLDTVKNLFLHVVPIDSGAGCIPLSSHFGVGVL
jgi:PKD repeat protein